MNDACAEGPSLGGAIVGTWISDIKERLVLPSRDRVLRTAEGRDLSWDVGDGLHIFDERPALSLGQQRTDDSRSSAVLKRMSDIGVAEQQGVEQELSRRSRGIHTDLHRIEVTPDEERLGTLL